MTGDDMKWLTAKEVAARIGIDVDGVYRSRQLRAVARNIGNGTERPSLRWTEADLAAAFPPGNHVDLEPAQPAPAPRGPGRPRRQYARPVHADQPRREADRPN